MTAAGIGYRRAVDGRSRAVRRTASSGRLLGPIIAIALWLPRLL
jgi:hypothetical protein